MALQNVAEASSLRTSEVIRTTPLKQQQHPAFVTSSARPLLRSDFALSVSTRSSSPALLPELRRLMIRLSRRMDASNTLAATRHRSAEHWENPFIPSGYTYLLQFVAHDLVHSAIPLSVAGGLGGGTANARRTPLRLETPVRQRSCRIAAHLRARCAERRPANQAAARADALEGERAQDRLPVSRHRANPRRERDGYRPQHRRRARRPHRGAGRRSPQRRSRRHVAADGAVRAAAQRAHRYHSPPGRCKRRRAAGSARPTSASCAPATH